MRSLPPQRAAPRATISCCRRRVWQRIPATRRCARRRVGEARNGATAVQQQTSAVLLARLELAEGRPQAALDMLAALPQALAEPAQSDAAAVRGQALFRLGRLVDAVRVLVEREVWLGDAPSILANQRMIWDGLRENRRAAAGCTRATPSSTAGSRSRRSLRARARICAARCSTWRQTYTTHPAAAGLLGRAVGRAALDGVPGADRAAAAAVVAATGGALSPSATASWPRICATRATRRPTCASTTRHGSAAAEAYLQAQLDGADFIVGPLLRPEVERGHRVRRASCRRSR